MLGVEAVDNMLFGTKEFTLHHPSLVRVGVVVGGGSGGSSKEAYVDHHRHYVLTTSLRFHRHVMSLWSAHWLTLWFVVVADNYNNYYLYTIRTA